MVPPSGLEAGDRILSAGPFDLRGASAVAAHSRLIEASGGGRRVPLTLERDGRRFEASIDRVPWNPAWWSTYPVGLGIVLCSALILRRAPNWHLSRRFALASLLFAITCARFRSPIFWINYLDMVSFAVCTAVAMPLLAHSALEFFEKARSLSLFQRSIPWLVGGLVGVAWAWNLWFPIPLPFDWWTVVLSSVVFIGLACIVGGLVWSFLRSEPLARRRYKWVLYGFVVGVAPLGLSLSPMAFGLPGFWIPALRTAAFLGLAAIPLGILIAVVWYDFLDIDRVMSATATFTVVCVVLVTGVFAIMPPIAQAMGPAVGVEPDTVQLWLSMALAASLIPLQQGLRSRVDRWVLKDQQRVEEGFEKLLDDLSHCSGLAEIARLTGARLDQLLKPESVVLYAQQEELFTPLYVRGRAVPPAFEAASPLIAALRTRKAPIAAERWSHRKGSELSPFDRAALETLGVAVIAPTRRGETFVGFFSLGPKRSGDIYTPTDLARLAAVQAKVSQELLRIDDARLMEEARQMQDALRSYVPGAVADELSKGRDLDSSEREVTVLFVDIRGFTGFSEYRGAEEIFSAVNRQTEMVSGIVKRHGGAVVEFNGDGMMAVFGAPGVLLAKERAAVEAAREIATSMERGGGGHPDLDVGVGIATGPAFVGNIRASDRLIWTVIGNTTNLAARLQALTRELDAVIAVDAPTRRAAGVVCSDFVQRPQVSVRGRMQRMDVHLLPLAAPFRSEGAARAV